MSKKKDRNKERYRGAFSEMIGECPVCRARSYPRVIADLRTPEEQEAVYCGSCKTDLRPFIEYYKAQKAKAEALRSMQEDQSANPSHVGPSRQILANSSETRSDQ